MDEAGSERHRSHHPSHRHFCGAFAMLASKQFKMHTAKKPEETAVLFRFWFIFKDLMRLQVPGGWG